ncbi:hypothetical protein [Paucilactobacillus wasatchensis]|uniref:Uncharacterized protein n=1 Tax=Paucilactobacillus wasatchensis TaxID=1335616 RepID=A0A0D1A965_9LACO|nr:hypothetical protein [Paucilactobacillus wasatchensis]KIS03291.1 hypothetical protein WDC_1109 [Paucilactobacillus wasatchensis]
MEYGINIYHRDEMDVCYIDWNTQEWFASESERDERLATLEAQAQEEQLNPKHRLHLDVKTYSQIEKMTA